MAFVKATSPNKDEHSDLTARSATDEKGAVLGSEFLGADTSNVDPKKVLLKMDLHLIPMLALLYLLSFLDRGNIGNARIEGLVETLNMTGPQYNWTCMASSGIHEPALSMVLTIYSDRFLLHLLRFRGPLQPSAQAT